MTAILGGTWSTSCVSRALKEAGFVYKVVVNQAAEADPEKQQAFRDMCKIRGYIADQYVFVDEVGTVSPPELHLVFTHPTAIPPDSVPPDLCAMDRRTTGSRTRLGAPSQRVRLRSPRPSSRVGTDTQPLPPCPLLACWLVEMGGGSWLRQATSCSGSEGLLYWLTQTDRARSCTMENRWRLPPCASALSRAPADRRSQRGRSHPSVSGSHW